MAPGIRPRATIGNAAADRYPASRELPWPSVCGEDELLRSSTTYGVRVLSAVAIGCDWAAPIARGLLFRVRSPSAATAGSVAAATVSVTDPSESIRSITHSSASSG